MSEIYIAPTRKVQPITPQQLQQRLGAAGLPVTLDEDSPETCWLVFEPHGTTIYASVEDGRVTLATVNVGFDDEPSVMAAIAYVMDEIGFSADEGADYA